MATKAKGSKKGAKKATKTKAAVTARVPNETKNDEVRPRAGGKTARVWEIADSLSKKLRRPATRAEVLEVAVEKEGASLGMASTQFGRWRRFNGLFGRATAEGTKKAAAKKAAPRKAAKAAKGTKKAASARKRAPKAPAAPVEVEQEGGAEE